MGYIRPPYMESCRFLNIFNPVIASTAKQSGRVKIPAWKLNLVCRKIFHEIIWEHLFWDSTEYVDSIN